MASISNDKNGKRRILFIDGTGKRRTIAPDEMIQSSFVRGLLHTTDSPTP